MSLVSFSANLSRDYFTDRQDRYVTFSNSPELADYYCHLLRTVSAHCYTVGSDSAMGPELGFDHLASRENAQKYRKILSKAIQRDVLSSERAVHEPETEDNAEFDTVVFPLLQMGYYGIEQEKRATIELLERLKKDEKLHLASGYFNLPPEYSNALLHADGNVSILAASPQVKSRILAGSSISQIGVVSSCN